MHAQLKKIAAASIRRSLRCQEAAAATAGAGCFPCVCSRWLEPSSPCRPPEGLAALNE